MSDEKRSRWKMPTAERDGTPRRPATARPWGGTEDEVTPPPTEITAFDAWEHTTSLGKRTANMLSSIAHSAGVGMQVGDELRDNGKRVAAIEKKLKWWQALAIAAITAAGSAVIGVAKGLYERGQHEGADEIRLVQMEKQAEQNRTDIAAMRAMVVDLILREATRSKP